MRSLYRTALLGVLFSTGAFTEEKITYESVTKGEAFKAFWSLNKQENGIKIKALKKEKEVEMECLADFSLVNYCEKKKDGKELTITKTGPCLIVKNYEKGKEKILSHKIENKLWIQEFTFGFQGFIKGKQKTCDFCIVYPKDLALHEMVATKEGDEELTVAGNKYDTYRVRITLAGFKKKFWKAYGWFDKKSGLLVQYKANEGPRTPYTETSLIEIIQ